MFIAINSRRHYIIALGLFVLFFVLFFSPVIIKDRILAPGDGLNFYYPAFERGLSLWSRYILAGYPAALDPQFLTWYPLRWLSPNFNFFVISAYILSGFFTYTLVWQLTSDSIGAWLAGLIYACGGFMVGHLGHTTIIHAAIWAPLLASAVNQMPQTRPFIWWGIGIAAICFAILAGHPQIAVYVLILGGTLAVYNTVLSSISLKKFDSRLSLLYFTCFALGIALSSIQLLPMADLAARSVRAQFSFEDFISYSLPFSHLPLVFFPFLYGPDIDLATGYFGRWNFTELVCYFGATTFVTLSPVLAQKDNKSARFWLITAIVALIFMIGKTPLGFVVYHLPVVGSFRAQARAGFLLILACAVLFGFVIASIRKRELNKDAARLAICCATLFYVAIAILIVGFYDESRRLAAQHGIRLHDWWSNVDLLQPLCLAVATGIWLSVTITRMPRTCVAGVALLVMGDLVSFGQRLEWKYASPSTPMPIELGAAKRSDSHSVTGRILPADGYLEPRDSWRPNLNEISHITSASGYGPLLPARYSEAAGVNSSGQFDYSRIDDTLLQLLNISQLSLNAEKNNASIVLGNGCGSTKGRGPVTAWLKEPIVATQIRIVSNLACSTAVSDGSVVATVEFLGSSGEPVATALPIRAGLDTAEWAIMREDVARVVKHHIPTVSRPLKGGPSFALEYETIHSLEHNRAPGSIYALRFSSSDSTQAVINFKTVELKNGESGKTQKISAIPLTDGTRWDRVEFYRQGQISAHYRKALGYAWLVDNVISLPSAAIAKAVQTSKLPDGKAFDAARTAVVENPSAELAEDLAQAAKGTVRVLSIENDRWLLESVTSSPAFLVISQSFDPGWRAYVDGRRTPLLATDYLIQGLKVPAGTSRIELRYLSASVILGAAVTGVSFIIVVSVVGFNLLRRKRRFS
jgi:hypothetical protein